MPRLLSAFGVLILLTVGISYLAITKLADANQDMGTMYQKHMLGAIHADNMEIARFSIGRTERDAMLNPDDPQILEKDENSMQADFQKFHENLDEAERTFVSKEGLAAVASIRDGLPAYEKANLDVFPRLRARDIAGAKASMAQGVELGKALVEGGNKAKELKETLAQKTFDANTESYQSTRMLMITATVVCLGLGIFMAFFIGRGFSLPLSKAVGTLEKVADGDLTVSLDVDTKDEVGRMASALNNALEKLRSTLEEVTQGAMHASSASQQLAAASQAIASGAQEQAASLEETSASLEEITATVRQSADNARQASQLASGSRDAAEQGQEVVSNAVTAMAEINAASAKIADIIGTIDEIAFQTNLLAVNAAVEAARAGEEGRGFAVVAAEVRSLAQRSAEAAKQIKALIQDSLRKVEKGTELVNKSGETLHGIVSSVKRVTDIVGEIAAAAGEQSTGIEQVNTAMTQMDQVTQSNSAQTEELSSTAESLSDQARGLMEQVGIFTLSKNSRSGHGPHRPAATAPVPPPVRKTTPALAHAVARKFDRKVARPAPVSKPGAPVLEPALAVAQAGGGHDDSSFEEF
ncbi:MAG TPA: methyl-accepting chemotaxis protein [Acidobacteriaceae bacterium]|nr:methyl-accepting chemotaxis protein [Acidobacteriaceae bacterium]